MTSPRRITRRIAARQRKQQRRGKYASSCQSPSSAITLLLLDLKIVFILDVKVPGDYPLGAVPALEKRQCSEAQISSLLGPCSKLNESYIIHDATIGTTLQGLFWGPKIHFRQCTEVAAVVGWCRWCYNPGS